MEDTICAIATSLGVGAISIIRVSGSEAIEIVNKSFNGSNLNNRPTHTITYGHIVDGKEVVDEVLVSIMRAPKSFTTEDVVEINCHGGINTTNRVLELILSNGARLALPGEFTKRAYLNGRIDLIEAEGIQDLIMSKTDTARKMALNQVSGNLSSIIKKCRQTLLDLLANIEVNIDYPEYEDALIVTNKVINERIADIKKKLDKIINESKNGQIIKDGINIALVGQPNVGKSSLLNKLLDEEKAIVTDIAGTTRDIVEGSITYRNIQLNFIDTAGIRNTNDTIEKMGVLKSIDKLKEADLVIILLNNNSSITKEDYDIIDNVKNNNKKYIIFINKIDLENKIDYDSFVSNNLVLGSTKNIQGIDTLKDKIIELFDLDTIETKDLTYLSNARQVSLAKKSYELLCNVEKNNNDLIPVDMLAIDLRSAWNYLGEIIGETYNDELLDALFSQFCLGK